MHLFKYAQLLFSMALFIFLSGVDVIAYDGFKSSLGFGSINEAIFAIENRGLPELRKLSIDKKKLDRTQDLTGTKKIDLSSLISLEVYGGTKDQEFTEASAFKADAHFWNVVSKAHDLQSLSLKNCVLDPTTNWKEVYRDLPKLKSIQIAFNTQVQPWDLLEKLGGFPSLESLALDSRSFANWDFEFLKTIPKLKKLIIGGYFGRKHRSIIFYSNFLKTIDANKGLEVLEFHNIVLDELSLKNISELPNLHDLRLGGCIIDVSNLKYLARIKNLKTLSFSNCHVQGKLSILKDDAEFFQGFSQLESLSVVSRFGFPLNRFKNFQNLKTLHLIDGAVSPEELNGIVCHNLKTLDLSHLGFVVTSEELNPLFNRNQIEKLRFFICDLDKQEIEKFTARPELRSLEIDSLHTVGEYPFCFSKQSLISHLSIAHLSNPPTVEDIARLKHLKSLKLNGKNYDINKLAVLKTLDRLESLTFERRELSTQNFLSVLKLKQLRQLRLPQCVMQCADLNALSELRHLTLLDLQEAYVKKDDSQDLLEAFIDLSKHLPQENKLIFRLRLNSDGSLMDVLSKRENE